MSLDMKSILFDTNLRRDVLSRATKSITAIGPDGTMVVQCETTISTEHNRGLVAPSKRERAQCV